MSNRLSTILDQQGTPFVHKNGKPRPELIDALMAAKKSHPAVKARYDAAQTFDESKNHWVDADALDADSSHSKSVRATLVQRSRFEIANNGYSDGIAQTYATDLVGGVGPKLRMRTTSNRFNQMVEKEWQRWAKAVKFRRKLWCMAHAKHADGEGIGVLRTNPGVKHPVKLDVVLYETEQCQTPAIEWGRGQIDGIKYDEFGNVAWYDILQEHPGSQFSWMDRFKVEHVPAEFVLHWYKLRRPGQHRGIPETTSTLNLGAAARRWRESTLTTAELIAKMTLFLKSMFQPNELDTVTPMSTIEVLAGMMTALPNNVEAWQPDVKQPAATYEMFHKALLNEQARPKSMPRNKAACDSSDYNFASGRLDHITYDQALEVDREDGNDLVLDPMFDVWFDEAIREFGWLGGQPDSVSTFAREHSWDWPKNRTADQKSEAIANDTNLRNGSLTLSDLYSHNGEDFEDALVVLANNYFGPDDPSGVERMREVLRIAIFQAQQPMPANVPDDEEGALTSEEE